MKTSVISTTLRYRSCSEKAYVVPLLLGEDRVDRMKIDEDSVWRCR